MEYARPAGIDYMSSRVSPGLLTSKVVIVDDHPLVLEGLEAILRTDSGLEIVGTACEAIKALDIVGQHQPDLLITDVNMPVDVFSFVKDAQKLCPRIKVLLVTAFDTESNLEMAIEVGVVGLVRKSDGTPQLLNAIHEILGGGQYFSQNVRDRIQEMRAKSSGKDGIKARHRSLSPREIEVLKLVAQGLPAKAIAKQLHISVKTVDRHKSNIMTKLELHNQVDLTRYAIREGLINP